MNGEYNCFSCNGQNLACVYAGRFIPYDVNSCLHKTEADMDEARLRARDFESIQNRKMFALFLFNKGDIENAVKVLPL